MTDSPPNMRAAIDAGVKAVLSQHGIEKRLTPTEDVVWPIVWVALEAAAPAIRRAGVLHAAARLGQLAEASHPRDAMALKRAAAALREELKIAEGA